MAPTHSTDNEVADPHLLQKGHAAAQTLLNLCTKLATVSRLETAILDECCAFGAGAKPASSRSVTQSLRVLIEAGQYKTALILLQKIKDVVPTRTPEFREKAADIIPR